MATRVVLHIGVMKSGTSFIQQVLLANRKRLAAQGILFPGPRWRDQVVAVRDVMAHDAEGADALAPDGPWHRMVAQIREWRGTAIVSMEYLGPRGEDKVRFILDCFPEADVQVVLTARDLARSITSMWTESVQNRAYASWPSYLRSVRAERVDGAGRAFWRQQRVHEIAERWARLAGREHFTLVTVPPRGAPPTLLWERFCEVAGIPADLCDLDVPRNVALDAPSAMVMRALNERLSGTALSEADYHRFVKKGLAKNGINHRPRRGEPVGLQERWVLRKAAGELDKLRALDLRVVGDLDELTSHAVQGVDPSETSAEEQLAAAIDGMAALLDLWGADVRRHRKRARKLRARVRALEKGER